MRSYLNLLNCKTFPRIWSVGVEEWVNCRNIIRITKVSEKVLFQVRSYLNSQNCKTFRRIWNVRVEEWVSCRYIIQITKVTANRLFQVWSYLNSENVHIWTRNYESEGFRESRCRILHRIFEYFSESVNLRYDRTFNFKSSVRFEWNREEQRSNQVGRCNVCKIMFD